MSTGKRYRSGESSAVSPTLRVPPQIHNDVYQPTGSVTNRALRKEAEQKWAEADSTVAQRQRKGRRKVRARAARQEGAREHKKEIARLSGELTHAKRRLNVRAKK